MGFTDVLELRRPPSIYRESLSNHCDLPVQLQELQQKVQASELRGKQLCERMSALERERKKYVINILDFLQSRAVLC